MKKKRNSAEPKVANTVKYIDSALNDYIIIEVMNTIVP